VNCFIIYYLTSTAVNAECSTVWSALFFCVKKLDILTDADTYRFLSKSTIHLIHLRATALGTVSRISCMMFGNVWSVDM